MKGKRILSAVLSAALLLQLSPLAVFAEDTSLLPAATKTVQTEPAPEEPTPEPAGEETALPKESAPEETAVPMAAPTPEPSAEPTAAPDPAAEVQALIDALPDEVTEDNAEAVEQALTGIDDAKQSLTDDELAGLDFARYDAAANALLALWGEAPTDEVETLDAYATPTKDGEWYVIDSVDDLYWLATSAPKNVQAKLTADITINSSVLDDDGNLISNPKLEEWKPIGTSNNPFKGTFDGQGHTISGLYVNLKKNYVGLFGHVGKGGTVKNVTLADSYVSGNISVGGICGWNDGGTVENCTSGCTVKGTGNSVGGICGSNQNGNRAGLVRNCHNTGKVTGTDFYIGGVCGSNYNSILQESDNSGKVSGKTEVGGVCGWNNKGTVQESYNIGEVSGKNFVGGVCGQNVRGTVKGCYNIGKVPDGNRVGGVCGGGSSTTGCYYLDTSGTDSQGESKTELQFKNGEVAYLLQKALDDAAAGTTAPQVWGQKLGEDAYPKLSSDDRVYQTTTCTGGYSNSENQPLDHNYVNGVCSRCGDLQQAKDVGNNCYEISNQGQLYWFANQVNTVNSSINAKLMDDITINSNVLNENGELNTGANFTPWTLIGTNTNPFTGTFNGNNKTISGLYYNNSGESDVGLFGCVGVNGKVINVTLADSYVSGKSYVGGICGSNMGGTLQGCHNTGTVSGNSWVGGVCGYNGGRNGSPTIQKCDNSGTVSGNSWVGGVCGSNSGTLQESYNTGEVSGTTQNVGGVCGYNFESGILQECYNNGNVTGTGNCVGGVCGQNNSSTVKGCYNTGEVTGNYPVGSVCGWNGGGTVEKCYYLAGTSAKAVGGGNEGVNCASKTELQFQNGDVAFLLQKDLGEGSAQVWGQRIDTDGTGETDKTPVLSNNPDYAVHPTATDSLCKGYSNKPDQKFDEHQYDKTGVCSRCGAWEPAEEQNGYYQITNQGQLRWFANLVNTASSSETKLNARLMNDITMDSTEWTPIGTSNEHPFTGDFDGNGKTITGLKCTDTSAYDVGLVGYASKATIQNVTVKDSSFIGNENIGAVCGSIIDGKIIGCTNSDSTVSGGFYNLGGIAGRAENTPVQRCFNSGAVIGKYSKIGGIVGQARSAAVQDCGNTGTVTKTENGGYYGGIIGLAESGSTIENCYNTDKNTAAKICGDGWYSLSNCYYLPNDTGSSGSTVTGITAKTKAQFASGEVAYLLQKGREQAVWGQKIDTDDYPKLGGDKVYQSAPCKSEYTNTESKTVEHVFGSDGICEKCGQPQIAYTVTIPATVTLGNTATITAKDVILPNGKELNVKVAEGSEFKVAQVDDNDAVVDKCAYTVTKGETKTPVNPSDTVLTAVNGESEKTVELQFNKPETTTYSGEYKGKVTFTVSVDDKSAS